MRVRETWEKIFPTTAPLLLKIARHLSLTISVNTLQCEIRQHWTLKLSNPPTIQVFPFFFPSSWVNKVSFILAFNANRRATLLTSWERKKKEQTRQSKEDFSVLFCVVTIKIIFSSIFCQRLVFHFSWKLRKKLIEFVTDFASHSTALLTLCVYTVLQPFVLLISERSQDERQLQSYYRRFSPGFHIVLVKMERKKFRTNKRQVVSFRLTSSSRFSLSVMSFMMIPSSQNNEMTTQLVHLQTDSHSDSSHSKQKTTNNFD